MLTLLVMCLFTSAVAAQDRLGVFIGASDLIGDDPREGANVEKAGIATGFLLPINLSSLKLLYKVRMLYHNADYPYRYDKNYDKYLQFANAILVGKELHTGWLTVLPQIGFGATNETIFDKWDSGFGTADLFIDYSLILRRDFDGIGIGLMASFQNGFIKPGDRMAPSKRLLISALVAL